MLSADKRSGQNLDRWTEENWEEEMMKHPMFVTQDAIDKGEMSPVIQVLIQHTGSFFDHFYGSGV